MIKRLAIAGAVLLLVAAGGVAALIATFDIDAWRPRLIAEAERATGRSVTIGGIAMQGWLRPSITLRDATLGNLPGGSRAEMVRVRHAELRVSWAGLLAGHIGLDSLRLDGADILFEEVNGTPNWAFDIGTSTAPSREMQIGELLVRDSRVAWPGGPAGGVELPRFTVHASGDLRSEGEIRWADTALRLTAQGGPLARIMGGAGGPMPIAALFEMDGARLALNGTLREPRGLQGYALEARGEAHADALRRIAQLAGAEGPIPAGMTFRARIAGSGLDWPAEQSIHLELGQTTLAPGLSLSRVVLESDGARAPLRIVLSGTQLAEAFTLEGSLGPWRPGASVPIDLTGTMRGHRLRLAGEVAEPQAGRGIALDAALESPIIGRVSARLAERGDFFSNGVTLSAIRAEGAAQQDGTLSISRAGLAGRLALARVDLDALPQPQPTAAPAAPPPARRDARLIPADPIDLSTLFALPMDLDLTVAALRHAGVEYRDVAARILVAEQRARLDPLEVTLPAGRVTLRAIAQQAERAAQLQIALRGDGLDIARLLPEWPVSGRAELDLDLRGQGQNWRAVAASLVGHAGLAVLNGHVDSRVAQSALPAGIGNLMEPRIGVACLAIRFDVVAGIAQARTLYTDTSLGRLNGGGRINLRDESLDLRINTDLRLPVLNAVGVRVRAPIPVGGTLAAPSVDTQALLGGAAAGTLGGMVPGLSQAMGVQGMPDCGPPLAVARGGRSGPVPRSLVPSEPAPVQNLLRGLGIR